MKSRTPKPSAAVKAHAMPKQAAVVNGTFPIVAIGASAGGLEAYMELFHALPLDTGMAFVLIQHLDPSHESMLTEIISKATGMPVEEVMSGVTVQPNHVYVIPPNTMMALAGGVFQLSPRSKSPGPHLAVNFFMHSLALERKSGAIAIVLSGTGADGTAGMEDIKAEGGITLVQDPATAKYDGMPRSVIDSGCADFILAPKKWRRSCGAFRITLMSTWKNQKKRSRARKIRVPSLVLSQKTWDWLVLMLSPPTQKISARSSLNFASPAASISASTNRIRFNVGHCAECCFSR